MNKNLTFQQRLHNAKAAQTVEEYKARHAYLHGAGYSREEWDTMWLDSPNTTWAHQFGRMVGYREVYTNNVRHMDRQMIMDRMNLMERYAELEGHDVRSVCSGGCHALTSDVIEVADDGLSARSFYLTPGTLMSPIGMDGVGRGNIWLWERYGSDFVYQDGRWYWFHEQVCPDIAGFYDKGNWAHDRYLDYISCDISIGDVGGKPAMLSEPGLFHADNNIVQTVQNTVPPPVPYTHLDDDNTYSPGRNDPTGKITVEVDPSKKQINGPYDPNENPFSKLNTHEDA